ncbi:MlaD family protein [Cytophagaceae bacterium ABcell3]|nr:MlaD family protein [Cytophagaceae bacterium ABcell3]
MSKEFKVGLLALTAGVILYIGFNFLKGMDFLSPTNKFHVVYDNIDGLTASNPVLINGFNVGRVNNIKFQPASNDLLVTLDVDKNIPLTDSTYARLTSSDILGGKSIELFINNGTRVLKNGDTLIAQKDHNITQQLSEKAMPLLSNIDSTIIKVNQMFGRDMENSIQGTMGSIQNASKDLEEILSNNKYKINSISTNLANLTNSLKETERSIKPVISKLNAIADSLDDADIKRVVDNANQSLSNLEQITAKIDRGEGNLGKLVHDSTLYNNLSSSLYDLDNLLIDFQENPKRYVNFSLISIGSGDRKRKKEQEKAAKENKDVDADIKEVGKGNKVQTGQ